MRAVKLSLFTEVQCPPTASPQQRLDELLAQAELADRLGYHGLWLSEIHFQPEFSLLAAPYVVLGAIAARTQRLRLGVAVNILPVHHPLHLAEQAATLDVLSHGRLEFAMGRGHVHSRVYEGFGAAREESRARQEESARAIVAAWTQETLEFHGAYYDIPEVVVTPKPVQRPHPPLHVAATSRASVEATAGQGLHLFMPVHLLPRAELCALAAAYWDGLRAHGHDPAAHELGLLLPLYVAATTEQARAEAREGFMDYYRVIHAIQEDYLRWPGRRGHEVPPPSARRPMTFERFCAEGAILADPATALADLQHLIAATGATQILGWTNMGSIPHARVMGSLQRFADEVMPHLPGAVARP
ncbi:MAG TPA: LLM class flavin-dependent oxidoreductase [Chloroflexota bacterium]|nr:LLM class flavin-dependent oxidoreductase [Chloroflexota bacterium]